jgi:hypothetical protein
MTNITTVKKRNSDIEQLSIWCGKLDVALACCRENMAQRKLAGVSTRETSNTILECETMLEIAEQKLKNLLLPYGLETDVFSVAHRSRNDGRRRMVAVMGGVFAEAALLGSPREARAAAMCRNDLRTVEADLC